MKNLWNDNDAKPFLQDALALRVYTSRLLGQEPALVLHGGGNTSVKETVTNLFGEPEEVLYVKGSGWDLGTIEAAGFAPVKLDVLQKMAALDELKDSEMVDGQRAAMLNPNAPNPSVEAILHAIIPFKFVDHTHADAVVAISNTPNGTETLSKIVGERVLIVPYVMPGFILAKQINEISKTLDWSRYDGIILSHHGVFSFSDDAQVSYSNMIDMVTKAENYLNKQQALECAHCDKNSKDDKIDNNIEEMSEPDLFKLATLRAEVSKVAGKPMLASLNTSQASCGFSTLANVADIATRGPLTPDHVIRTKRIPLIVGDSPDTDLEHYIKDYKQYFKQHGNANLTCLNPEPRWAVWPEKGTISFGSNYKETRIIADIVGHTIRAIQWAEKLGGWEALPAQDIFDLEYWELEQAKLNKNASSPEFAGKIALVTGAANGIGKACAEALHAKGAVVVALDINPEIKDTFQRADLIPFVCDVTDDNALKAAVQAAVQAFGGLDIVVSNAGTFPPSKTIADMDAEVWDKSMQVNLTSHQRLITACQPYLKRGIDPAIVIIASKNVPAPGPGAAAYSVAKAGVTQLARIAALEMGKDNIRVNVLHPNAVFDTAIWTDEVLLKRAQHYGLTVEEYKTNNILKQEVTSKDVAELACAMVGELFAKTTGAQLPIDGGNERVI